MAARLGNTPTICRKCYVHPDVLNSYLDGSLVMDIKAEIESELRDDVSRLQPEEAAVLAFLRARLQPGISQGCSPRPANASCPAHVAGGVSASPGSMNTA